MLEMAFNERSVYSPVGSAQRSTEAGAIRADVLSCSSARCREGAVR